MAGVSSSTRSPELLVGTLAVGVFVALAAADGGFEPTASGPAALFLLGLLVSFGFASRRFPPALPRRQLYAIGAFLGFAAWAFISILWADDKGVAWEGANRVLLYGIVVALFALPSWSSRSAAQTMGLYSLAIAALGAGFFLATTASQDPSIHFVDVRFAEPTGYHNASVALFLGAFWPALFLSSRREVPWLLRGAFLAAAGLLLELALVAQSRGWLLVFPIAAALYLALVPGRLRNLAMAAPLALTIAVASVPLLDVLPAARDEIGLSGALDDATTAMLASVTALFLLGCLAAIFDRSVRIPERLLRRARSPAAASGALAMLVGAIVALAVIGNPVTWAEDRWDDFTSGQAEFSSGSQLGESLGSNRYDFWRVAADQFVDAPLSGAGVDNFAADYLEERRTLEEPLYPHNLPLQVLGGTGLVGAALLVAFFGLAGAGLVRTWRAPPDPLGRGVATVAAVAVTYWFLHGTGDWFWAMPAVSAPPLAWLVMAGRLEGHRGAAPARLRVPWPSRPTLRALLTALLLAFALSTYALPWAAARDVEEAQRIWPRDPGEALDRIDRASDLNFLSSAPDLAGGTIAALLGDRGKVRSYFEDALEREPRSWYARLELGGLAALEGDRTKAIAQLRKARRLNPRDPTTRLVLERAEAGRPLALEAISQLLAQGICDRLGRTQATDTCPP
jgi:tetratricopeptide (TPR) repeat protein